MLKNIQLHETKPLTTGQAVTLQVPIFGTIENLILRFNLTGNAPATEAAIRAQIGNIRLTFNGRDIVNASVSSILDAYEVMGNNVRENLGVDGNVELNLARLMLNDPSVRDNLGWGTADIQTIQVTVTAGTISTVLGVQAISGRINVNRVLGAYGKFISYPQSFNATGDHTVDTLPRDPDSAYAMVLADDGASGTITNGELRVNNITIMERVPRDTNQLILSSNRLVQPAGYFVYALNDGAQDSILPMQGVTDLRFITTFSVAPGAAGYTLTPLTINGLKLTK